MEFECFMKENSVSCVLAVIGFENHRIRCIIGVYPRERILEQELLFDLKVLLDISKCVLSDDVGDALDYEILTRLCSEFAEKNKYKLIEKLAADILEELFKRDDIMEAWIKIKKPLAIPTADFAFVEMTKKRRF